jgi:hypothetical protein
MELPSSLMLDLGASHNNGNHCTEAKASIVQHEYHPLGLTLCCSIVKKGTIKMIIEVSQNELNEDGNIDDILTKEIE